jgi:hypothetical protein
MRRLLNLLPLLSLLLCVASCASWVRSYAAQFTAFAGAMQSLQKHRAPAAS